MASFKQFTTNEPTLTVTVRPRRGVAIAFRLLWDSIVAAIHRDTVTFYVRGDEPSRWGVLCPECRWVPSREGHRQGCLIPMVERLDRFESKLARLASPPINVYRLTVALWGIEWDPDASRFARSIAARYDAAPTDDEPERFA